MKKNRFLVSSLAAIVLGSNANFCLAVNPDETPTNEQSSQVTVLDIEKSIDINLQKLKIDPFFQKGYEQVIALYGSHENFKDSIIKGIEENQDLIINLYGSFENYNRSLQDLPEKFKNLEAIDSKINELKMELSGMINDDLKSDKVQDLIAKIDQLMKDLSWVGFKGSEELKKWSLKKFANNPEELEKYNEAIFNLEQDQDKKYGEGFSKFFNSAVEYYVENHLDSPTNTSITVAPADHQSNIIDVINPVVTDRLKIELTTEEDCLHLAKYFKDKGIQDTFCMERELSESEALKHLKTISSNSLFTGLMKIFTIKTLENEPIGQILIGLKDINTPNCITVSSWIGKPFWGKSIAPEAVCALLSQVDVPNIDIAIYVSSTNEKSKRAILKTGEKLGAFIKDSNGEYIPQAPENSKFYLKEKNIYRYVYTKADGDDSQLNIKSYKNDVLLSEQNIAKGMFQECLFKNSSGIEYIFSKTLI